jgi:hypothetical protein
MRDHLVLVTLSTYLITHKFYTCRNSSRMPALGKTFLSGAEQWAPGDEPENQQVQYQNDPTQSIAL